MAKHHNRFDLVNRIIKAKDGYATKRITKEIDIADDWDEVNFLLQSVTSMRLQKEIPSCVALSLYSTATQNH